MIFKKGKNRIVVNRLDSDGNVIGIDTTKEKNIQDKLVVIKSAFARSLPFFASLAYDTKFVNAVWVDTVTTDGRTIYYNQDYFNDLSLGEMAYVIAHVLMHGAYNHIYRIDSRDPEIWHLACDYQINGELVGADFASVPPDTVVDMTFNGLCAEEIYEKLYEEHPKNSSNGSSNEDDSSGPGTANFDQIVSIEDTSDDDNVGNGDDVETYSDGYSPGTFNSLPTFPDDYESKESERQIQRLVRATELAKNNLSDNKSAGYVPAGVQIIIDSLGEAKIDWREYIVAKIKSLYKENRSFKRPSRRQNAYGNIIIPGYIPGDAVKVHIALDTSGSMGKDQIRDCLTEVQGVIEQFDTFEVHVWCFDGEVVPGSYCKFDHRSDADIQDYAAKYVGGGGGTMFESNWNFLRSNEMKPDLLMVFTDGYPCGTWGDPDYCETIFLIHGDPKKEIQAPFGMTLHYEA